MDLHKRHEPDTPSAGAATQEFENFIYLVSHDVRASVRALLELPQWIEEDIRDTGLRIDGSLRENLDLMNVHMRRLDRMLIDLLIYSRIGRMQSGGDALWDEAVDAVLEQMRMPQGFRLVRDIRAPSINMGRNDVITLVSSLLSNSIKHHDRPQGTVRLSTYEDGPWLCLDVADDGPGIPEAARSRAFEVMTTLRPRDQVEGSGMGLANVRKIVAHYGGQIDWVESDDGRGCHLSMRFPKIAVALH